jgi:hypothetical protein
MHRILLGSLALAFMCLPSNLVHGQGGKTPLVATGWGSLYGKVTLDGKIPDVVDLTPKMKEHVDKACCLDPKALPIEKIDATWLVDKNKGIANVMVWITPPAKTYFPIHEKLKVRKEEIVIDQPHCAFLPRVSAYQPFYFDGKKEVETGQKLILRNSATVPHNVRATGGGPDNPGFNKTVIAKSEISVTLVPYRLPVLLNCDLHTWMSAKVFVFDHPYYAKTKEDGTFEIPLVPAGAEVTLLAWHEANGWAIRKEGEKLPGQKMTLKEGKNEFNITIAAPK